MADFWGPFQHQQMLCIFPIKGIQDWLTSRSQQIARQRLAWSLEQQKLNKEIYLDMYSFKIKIHQWMSS